MYPDVEDTCDRCQNVQCNLSNTFYLCPNLQWCLDVCEPFGGWQELGEALRLVGWFVLPPLLFFPSVKKVICIILLPWHNILSSVRKRVCSPWLWSDPHGQPGRPWRGRKVQPRPSRPRLGKVAPAPHGHSTRRSTAGASSSSQRLQIRQKENKQTIITNHMHNDQKRWALHSRHSYDKKIQCPNADF